MAFTQTSNLVKPSTKVATFVMTALFLSGLSAISYEIVWQRLLVRTTGATLPAVSSIFCVFIAGLYIGSLVSIPLLRSSRSPLRLYAFIELGIAAFGIAIPGFFSEYFSVPALQTIRSALHQSPGSGLDAEMASALVQNALSFVVLFLPAALMGVTFNCVTRYTDDLKEFGQSSRFSLSTFYVVNLLGGAFGCLLSSFGLIPNVGLAITSMLMALINLVVFFLLFASSLLSQPLDDPFAELLALFSPPENVPGVDSALQTDSLVPTERLAVDDVSGKAELPPPQGLLFAIALAVIVSGAIMALEVTWTRLMMLLLGSSTYSTSGVLLMALLAFALSAIIVARSVHNKSLLISAIPRLVLAASFLIMAGMWLVPYIPLILLLSQRYFSQTPIDPLLAFLIPRLTICGAIVLPPLIVMGSIFPILLGLSEKASTAAIPDKKIGKIVELQSSEDYLGSRLKRTTVVGLLLAASSAGSVAGCLVAGFALIPQSSSNGYGSQSGIETALTTISLFLLLMCISIHVSMRDKSKPLRNFVVRSQIFMFCCFLCGFATCLRPAWDLLLLALGPAYFQIPTSTGLTQEKLLTALRKSNGGKTYPLFYKEGANATVTVEQNLQANVRYLKTDGKIEAALPIDWRLPAPTSDAATQLILACLPFYFLETKTNVDSFVIGYGSGITSGGVDCRPELRSLKIAELEPSVYRASRWFVASNLDPFQSARKGIQRVWGLIVDGRSYLRVHQNIYDIIISQPSEPWITGASDLFTREFWQLAKSRLSSGGVLCQWIQVYSIDQKTLKILLATFSETFPDAYLVHPSGAGEVLLIGLNGKAKNCEVPDVQKLNAFFKANGELIAGRLLPTGEKILPPALTCDFLLGPDQLRKLTLNSQINTDDRLFPEYALPYRVIARDDNVTENLKWLSSQ